MICGKAVILVYPTSGQEKIRDRFDSDVIPFKQKSHEKAKAWQEYYNNLIDAGRKLNVSKQTLDTVEGLSHGTSTFGLIAGEHPAASVSSHGRVHLSTNPTDLARQLANREIRADIASASLGYNSTLENIEYADGVKRMLFLNENINTELVEGIKGLPDTTIWVNSAGNSFPHYFSSTMKQIKDKVIVVGSADPGGFPSIFSQADESVDILAPSDHFIRSIDADGKLVKFSGTSGAAPLVSGVLADVKAILPDLTRDDAVKMLQLTATNTSINEVSRVNGAGVLNHYKMLRVAQRIATGLQEDSSATIGSLLQDPKVVDFNERSYAVIS